MSATLQYPTLEVTPMPLMQPLAEYTLQQNEKIETAFAETVMSIFDKAVLSQAQKNGLSDFEFALSNGTCVMQGQYFERSHYSPPFGHIVIKGSMLSLQEPKEEPWYKGIFLKKSELLTAPTSYQYNAICVNFDCGTAREEEVFYDPDPCRDVVRGINPGMTIHDVLKTGDLITINDTRLRGELTEQRMGIAKELLDHLDALQNDIKTGNFKLAFDK